MKPTCVTALITALIGSAICIPLAAAPPPKADLVIVGTGISGLAAALDAGRAGANVTVIDMWSVFGGQAVMSGGLVCLVDTPFQRATNIVDSPDLAIDDFLKHGKDANPNWVHLYAHESRREVYDWLDKLGVGWSQLFPRMPGNSVQRQHVAEGRGVGLVSSIHRECLRWTNIHFVWNTKSTSLLIENSQVRGVRGVGRAEAGQRRHREVFARPGRAGERDQRLRRVRPHGGRRRGGHGNDAPFARPGRRRERRAVPEPGRISLGRRSLGARLGRVPGQ